MHPGNLQTPVLPWPWPARGPALWTDTLGGFGSMPRQPVLVHRNGLLTMSIRRIASLAPRNRLFCVLEMS